MGEFRAYKVLSTPKDPSIATMQGIAEMAQDEGLSVKDFLTAVEVIVHGTTVTTNAVLTYRGAKTGLITTNGVRDALEMRRGIREEQYNNRYANVTPLAPRYLRLPVAGRLDYAGNELTPLDEDGLRSAVEFFKKEDVSAVAVCFMNSFACRDHEDRARSNHQGDDAGRLPVGFCRCAPVHPVLRSGLHHRAERLRGTDFEAVPGESGKEAGRRGLSQYPVDHAIQRRSDLAQVCHGSRSNDAAFRTRRRSGGRCGLFRDSGLPRLHHHGYGRHVV